MPADGQFVQNIKALMPNKEVVLAGDRSTEQEEPFWMQSIFFADLGISCCVAGACLLRELQQLAREYLEEQGMDLEEMLGA